MPIAGIGELRLLCSGPPYMHHCCAFPFSVLSNLNAKKLNFQFFLASLYSYHVYRKCCLSVVLSGQMTFLLACSDLLIGLVALV